MSGEQMNNTNNKKDNSCYTYFSITGDFDPDEVTEILELQPYKSWKIGDLRHLGGLSRKIVGANCVRLQTHRKN